MSLSYYNPHDRYRKRFAERMAGVVVFIVVIGVSVGAGFWLGKESMLQENRALHESVKILEGTRESQQNLVTELRADVQTAEARLKQLRDEIQSQMPDGPVGELLRLVRKQVEEGSDPERLSFLIRSGRPPRNCSEPETRRFVVSTPTYKGPDSTVSIAEGRVVIKASGVSARNDKGQAEAWYDPSRAISLDFLKPDGQKDTKKGVMPIHHGIVIDEREYRFTIEEGARSFAKVTFDSCDYP